MTKFKMPKNTFMASNFFMQMSNVSTVCTQSIRRYQWKLWYELNFLHMHYLAPFRITKGSNL